MNQAYGPIRILVADQNPAMLNAYRSMLDPESGNPIFFSAIEQVADELGEGRVSLPVIDVIFCSDSDELLNTFRNSARDGKEFAVAFLDMKLVCRPNDDKTLESIRQMDPCVEMVIVSDAPTFQLSEAIARVLPAHKRLLIQKPYHLRETIQFTSTLVSKWLVEKLLLTIQAELEKRVGERTADLQKERNFISAILETAGALMMVLERDGRLVRFNRACEELSGYSADHVKGRYVWDVFGVKDKMDSVKQSFESLRNGKFPQNFEHSWEIRDGSLCRINWSGTVLLNHQSHAEYAVWIGLDITNQKRVEDELRSSEERYRALIENVKDGVALVQNERIVFANDAFLSMFGAKQLDQVIGKNVNTLVDPQFHVRFGKFLSTTMDKKSWGLSFRGQCLRENGGEFWAEILSSVIRHQGYPALLFTVRDITENMMWEQTIKQEAEYFRSENIRLKSTLGERYRMGDIIGKSPAMQAVYELILKAASTDANVIILGRSGTGKELAARAIHDMSDRSDKPFIPVHCGAIPENLIESEFFGHRKGAFTGAISDRPGYLHAANGGTLFLDEIGEIALNMQVKLLRALEGGNYTPIGDSTPKIADIRIVGATNKDPSDLVNSGAMREDFFYRISVIPITLPPLKDRKEDIPLLVEHFLQKFSRETKIQDIPETVMRALFRYDYPGNVRELQNVLQRYLTVKSLDFLKISVESPADEFDTIAESDIRNESFDLEKTLDHVERKILTKALDKVRWNKSRTSELLGISRRSLFRRMKRLNIV